VNKKRKILTIVALAVFGIVIFFHYKSIYYRPAHEQTEYFVDKTGKPWLDDPPIQGRGGHWLDQLDPSKFPTPTKRMTADEFLEKNARYPGFEGGEFVIVEYPARGPSLRSHPVIKDVRMPLFVLAVFFAGLFFILAEQKPRS
jgi:hypothetical protein